jgi:hypothetical protein
MRALCKGRHIRPGRTGYRIAVGKRRGILTIPVATKRQHPVLPKCRPVPPAGFARPLAHVPSVSCCHSSSQASSGIPSGMLERPDHVAVEHSVMVLLHERSRRLPRPLQCKSQRTDVYRCKRPAVYLLYGSGELFVRNVRVRGKRSTEQGGAFRAGGNAGYVDATCTCQNRIPARHRCASTGEGSCGSPPISEIQLSVTGCPSSTPSSASHSK